MEAMIRLVGPAAKEPSLRASRPGPLMPRVTCWVSWSFIKVSTLAWLVPTSISESKQLPQCSPRERRKANTGLLRQDKHSGLSRPESLPPVVSAKEDRTLVASACVATCALHGAGAWEEHIVSSHRATNAAYMAPFRRIVSTRFDLEEAPWSDYAVCRQLGVPTIDIAQAVHRLLHLPRVLQHGPDRL